MYSKKQTEPPAIPATSAVPARRRLDPAQESVPAPAPLPAPATSPARGSHTQLQPRRSAQGAAVSRPAPLVRVVEDDAVVVTVPDAPAVPAVPEQRPRPQRVTLRRARGEDVELVWEWGFEAELRAAMRSPRVVLYRHYEQWFAVRLADRLTAIWIIEDAGASAGVVLIDRNDKQGLPRLTIVLGRRARGRGIGRRALELACEQWQRPLLAEVDAVNESAIACLEASGFERTIEREDGAAMRYSFLWSP